MATVDTFKYEEDVTSIPAGETLFREGDTGDVLFVVQEGELQITVGDKPIETIGPGGLVGEMALIDKRPRSATVVATQDTRLVVLDEKGFLNHVHRTPFFSLQVMRVLVARLRARHTDL